ncbi:Nif3-like dinuclear metal center hexameric protein [Helicobacter cappadocius]|uniref:GTP cyclohydrolase 1 type 2 homolog n=1 Tax=Helicobacter cappadocius TaxID=3063998 RepID=A0AA90PSK2_9HELI|nr:MULTISPECIES: Nif3-like dinuclear metal center hexameric protein [unclassified Helicobacter]MDO7253455.1 Nif3-like dinuclear metal center hexameric protein [Helicobacter sp. faydin-H75]MDP2539382.1 Nif3-like dinuclear metal center hexameric protein [Helicobacter sp. faydin-H76]
MKVFEIYDCLNLLSPFQLQEKWDNSGLNIGSQESEISKIYACLEVNEEIAKELHPQSLIISHHPLLFKPIKNFTWDAYPANIAKILIEKNCSLICMHTNFDTTHLNPYFAKEILGFENLFPDGIALRGNLEGIEFVSLLEHISKSLKLTNLKYTQSSDTIDSVAIICGAGSSYLYSDSLKPNSCLITGDIKYHDAMIAKSLKISLIDVGHYPSERFFPEILKSILKTKGYKVIIKDCKNPFTYLEGQKYE